MTHPLTTTTSTAVLLLHVLAGEVEGWGECVAMEEPLYSSEYVDAPQAVIRDHLMPRVFAAGAVAAEGVGPLLNPVKGDRMAKAAIEMAWLDGCRTSPRPGIRPHRAR